MIEFQIPWPPSVNHYWEPRVVRGQFAGMRVGRSGLDYRHSVIASVRRQLGLKPPLEGPLSVEIDAYPPDHRRRDVDNLLKAVLDSLGKYAARVFDDDFQVTKLNIERKEPDHVGGGSLVVRVFGV